MLRFVDGWTEHNSKVIKDPKFILKNQVAEDFLEISLAAFVLTMKDRYHCLLLLAVARALDE